MSANFLQGFLGTQQAGIEARNDITVAVRNWFANRNPLVTRLPYVPVERVDFLMYSHQYRNRSTTLGVAISASTTTGLTLGDCTFLMNHDVLELVDSNGIDASGSRSTATRPARTRHRVARRRRHDRDDHALDDRDRRQPDRQQPDRRRGQSDRSDHDRRLADPVLPDLPVPGADRRLGPDGSGPGYAGRHSIAVRLQHDDPAPEHGRRHREHLLLRDLARPRTTRPARPPR